MTQPAPPDTVGAQPINASELNTLVGNHLRNFVTVKNTIGQDRDFLAAEDLKAAPYYLSADQETLIKTAVLQLDQALDAVDMTFIVQLVGLY